MREPQRCWGVCKGWTRATELQGSGAPDSGGRWEQGWTGPTLLSGTVGQLAKRLPGVEGGDGATGGAGAMEEVSE